MDCDIVIGGEITNLLTNRMDKLKAIMNEENKYNEKPDYLSLAYYGESGGAIGAAVLNNVAFFIG